MGNEWNSSPDLPQSCVQSPESVDKGPYLIFVERYILSNPFIFGLFLNFAQSVHFISALVDLNSCVTSTAICAISETTNQNLHYVIFVTYWRHTLYTHYKWCPLNTYFIFQLISPVFSPPLHTALIIYILLGFLELIHF